MPSHANEASPDVSVDEIIATGIACPQTTTIANNEHGTTIVDYESDSSAMPPAAGDNTAAGMALAQEEHLYSIASEEDMHKDKIETPLTPESGPSNDDLVRHRDDVDIRPRGSQRASSDDAQASGRNEQLRTPPLESIHPHLPTPLPTPSSISRGSKQRASLRTCDHDLNPSSDAKPWDISRKIPSTSVPSSLFHPYAKYTGTQQSDRQIYNVTVTILTVDMQQCTLSGYLEICGLTPDHPKLTTFFTGEIIGGPEQQYSFRTKDPAWGASNKTDMTHWARFPSWRPLSTHAKNDIEFVHPVDGGDWWQEEHVFMRWKEHFLVPDHKLRSIQGASFEGFYYICLNQIQGSISGIYFHSKSEK